MDWGGVSQLAEFIEHVSLSEDRISRRSESLKTAVESAARALRNRCCKRVQEDIALKLMQENDSKGQTIKMAMAILVNALVFHITIAKTSKDKKVKNIEELKNSVGSLKNNISKEWREISSKINYRPIYDLAVDVLEPIGDKEAEAILESLIDVATDIATMGATSQHDFGGQLFQKLINDRKFLASYYTLPSSAAFLAELAVPRINVKKWTDRGAVTKLRVGDFACGTGALLSATYNAIRSIHCSEGADDSKIHRDMMENVFVGFDIMPAATHLTTSVLSSVHPTVIFQKTDIVTLLYGVHEIEETGNPETCIGSLEYIVGEAALPLFATGQDHYSGTEGKVRVPVSIPHETFDLVVMNPPFKRPTDNDGNFRKEGKPNPAFAGLGTTDEDQNKMSKRREEIYKERSRKPTKNNDNQWYREKNDRAGEGRAGLGTWFMDLADVKVKKGGVVALIIPATFAGGEFWKKMRRLLANRYRDVLVVSISSSSKNGTAFSEDTGMGECIVVATRKFEDDDDEGAFTSVTLDKRPTSILEAVQFAKAINAKLKENESGRLCIGTQKFGRMSHSSSAEFVEAGAGGIQDEAVEMFASKLKEGVLHLPRFRSDVCLPIVHLKELGKRCKDSKFIVQWGPFEKVSVSRQASEKGNFEYPILWAHERSREKDREEWKGWESRMMLGPDHEGITKRGREAEALEYWNTYASRLYFNRDFRLTSQSLAACMTRKKAIGGRAWPNFKCHDENWNEPIVLWMNTTLGLVSFWFKGTRQQAGRSLLHLGPQDTLPVYDMRTLTGQQIELAKKTFKEFSGKEFLRANRADSDSVRRALDKAVLIDLLGLPESIMESLDLLRTKWCNEPSLRDTRVTQ